MESLPFSDHFLRASSISGRNFMNHPSTGIAMTPRNQRVGWLVWLDGMVNNLCHMP